LVSCYYQISTGDYRWFIFLENTSQAYNISLIYFPYLQHGSPASNEKYGVPILADGLPQKIADPFDYGGGFIDPNRAVDPGLAYDVDPNDYTLLLDCISAANSSCEFEPINMNLPSIAIPNLKEPTTVLRTVTNVGQADAVYKAVVKSPPGMKISVEPSVLQFSQSKKKQSFKVIFSMTRKFQGGYLFGSLAWYDGGTHYVRIPIAVRPIVSDNYADLWRSIELQNVHTSKGSVEQASSYIIPSKLSLSASPKLLYYFTCFVFLSVICDFTTLYDTSYHMDRGPKK
jgi:hypothetical protein